MLISLDWWCTAAELLRSPLDWRRVAVATLKTIGVVRGGEGLACLVRTIRVLLWKLV